MKNDEERTFLERIKWPGNKVTRGSSLEVIGKQNTSYLLITHSNGDRVQALLDRFHGLVFHEKSDMVYKQVHDFVKILENSFSLYR